jgi:hypothetical protein
MTREQLEGIAAFVAVVIVFALFAIMIADCIIGADGQWRAV